MWTFGRKQRGQLAASAERTSSAPPPGAGLARDTARASALPVAAVESWFHGFTGDPGDRLFSINDRPDADFEDVDPCRADQDLATYQASVEQSRAAAAGRSLDDLIREPSREPTSLRWVY